MKISIAKLSDLLEMSMESTYRLLDLLLPPGTALDQFISLPTSHPLCLSIRQAKPPAKPLYTLSELSNLYEWHKQNYSVDSITLKLNEMNIPTYSRGPGSKIYVYLSDLTRGLQGRIDQDYLQTSEKQITIRGQI